MYDPDRISGSVGGRRRRHRRPGFVRAAVSCGHGAAVGVAYRDRPRPTQRRGWRTCAFSKRRAGCFANAISIVLEVAALLHGYRQNRSPPTVSCRKPGPLMPNEGKSLTGTNTVGGTSSPHVPLRELEQSFQPFTHVMNGHDVPSESISHSVWCPQTTEYRRHVMTPRFRTSVRKVAPPRKPCPNSTVRRHGSLPERSTVFATNRAGPNEQAMVCCKPLWDRVFAFEKRIALKIGQQIIEQTR